MTLLDFTFEFKNEVDYLSKNLEYELYQEAATRLRALKEGHTDLIGAAASLESLTKGDETPHIYRARVVVYGRPEHVASVAKQENPIMAMKEALEGIERQVRERRIRLAQRTQKQAAAGTNEGLYELSAQEIYQAYTNDSLPDVWLEQSRERIAARLMLEENLNQEDAYYAADQILAYAQEILENPHLQEPRG